MQLSANKQANLIRLNKYLADLGIASRRKADELITAGEVMVNGLVAVMGQRVDPARTEITVRGKSVTITNAAELEYWAVYKPRGYVSTVTDPEKRPVAVSLVKSKARLFPVGRLDIESEGLLLLTNDGELTNVLTHPRYHVPKTYHVWVTGEVKESKLNKLRRGVKLSDGMTAPCEVVSTMLRPRKAALTITLFEGRSRQIRRMMPAIDLEVNKLVRIALGPISLGAMRVGQARRLTPEEVAALYSLREATATKSESVEQSKSV